MHFKRSVTFRLKTDKRSKVDESNIIVRATWCGNRVEFHSSHKINPAQWDAKRQQAKGKSNREGTPVAKINQDLATLRGYLDEIFNRYEFINKQPPTPQEVRVLFDDMTGRKPIEEIGKTAFVPLGVAFDRFITAHRTTWENSTKTGYKAVKTHLLELFGDVDTESITPSDIDKYQTYLLNERKARNTYAKRATNKLKTFLRWCKKVGIYSGNAHEKATPKLKGVNNKEIIVLTPSELATLMGATFTEEQRHLEQTRDVLLFACFTGLRFSDIQTLTPANIRGNTLNLVTKKTSDHLVIDLNKTAKEIITKYKDKQQDGKLLPITSNQKTNQNLKELGKLLHIDTPTQITYYNKDGRQIKTLPKYELITTHIGRRTFISNALSLGIPAGTVMSWTGHKDYSAMKPYIKLIEEMKRTQMGLFDDFTDKIKSK